MEVEEGYFPQTAHPKMFYSSSISAACHSIPFSKECHIVLIMCLKLYLMLWNIQGAS